MGKLATRDSGKNRQFKPQIYQSKRRGQSRNFYDTYYCDRGNYQNRYGSIPEVKEFNVLSKIEVYQCMNKPTGEKILEVM